MNVKHEVAAKCLRLAADIYEEKIDKNELATQLAELKELAFDNDLDEEVQEKLTALVDQVE